MVHFLPRLSVSTPVHVRFGWSTKYPVRQHQLPLGDGSISIHGFLYKIVLMPIFGETGGSLAYALLFCSHQLVIGYQLYKRKIYIKI